MGSLAVVFEEFSEVLREDSEGLLAGTKPEFRVFGQSALIEANIDLKLQMTKDVDAFARAKQNVLELFRQTLLRHGLHFDNLSDEAWMPDETEYDLIFDSLYVSAYVAQPEYVLVSKALKAREKNKVLIAEYLGNNPSSLFMELSQKYQVDLAWFLD